MAGNKHALVIGASGLIGWAVVDQLLQPYPSPSPFGKITALVNRPLRKEDALWPEESPDRPTLSLTSGVNLQCEDDEFERLLKEKVPDAECITHVFYFGEYFDNAEKYSSEFAQLSKRIPILRRRSRSMWA